MACVGSSRFARMCTPAAATTFSSIMVLAQVVGPEAQGHLAYLEPLGDPRRLDVRHVVQVQKRETASVIRSSTATPPGHLPPGRCLPTRTSGIEGAKPRSGPATRGARLCSTRSSRVSMSPNIMVAVPMMPCLSASRMTPSQVAVSALPGAPACARSPRPGFSAAAR